MKAVGEDVSCLIIVLTGKDCFFFGAQLSLWKWLIQLVVSLSWIELLEMSETDRKSVV